MEPADVRGGAPQSNAEARCSKKRRTSTEETVASEAASTANVENKSENKRGTEFDGSSVVPVADFFGEAKVADVGCHEVTEQDDGTCPKEDLTVASKSDAGKIKSDDIRFGPGKGTVEEQGQMRFESSYMSHGVLCCERCSSAPAMHAVCEGCFGDGEGETLERWLHHPQGGGALQSPVSSVAGLAERLRIASQVARGACVRV